MIQFGSSIGIGPMALDTVVVKTSAAILAATVQTRVEMNAAKILFANGTGHRAVRSADETYGVWGSAS
jgi:hypothetical protein